MIFTEFRLILEQACIVGRKIVAAYLHNACSQLFVYGMDGSNKTELPLTGLLNGIFFILTGKYYLCRKKS
jgi:prolyl oligopeptidase PreP (S9A serine peptidase family)